MTRTPFEQAMEAFRAELLELVKKRNAIETRITQVSHAMEAMAGTCEDFQKRTAYIDDIRGIAARIGFQDAIRSLLALNRAGLTAIGIRDLITKNQWMDLSQYSNPLASIYTTLRRMKDSGEVEEIEKDGDKAYKLKMAPRTRGVKLGLPALSEEERRKVRQTLWGQAFDEKK